MAFPTNVDATWVNPSSVQLDAGELRRADAAIFAGANTGFGVRGGIVLQETNSLLVSVDASDNVTVKAGPVVIPGNAVANTGPYRYGLANDATGTLTGRNGTNPRMDLVVARQLDTDVVSGHGAYTGRIEILAGTPNATPANGMQSLPSMAVELARITVPATGGGAASVDLSYRTFASAINAPLLVTTAARLPASGLLNQRCRTYDADREFRWNGTAWVAAPERFTGNEGTAYAGSAPPAGMAKLIKQASVIAGVGSGAVGVSFHDGAFPNGIVSLEVSPGDNVGSLGFFQVPISGISLTGFTAYPWQAGSTSQVPNGINIRLNYVAIGW